MMNSPTCLKCKGGYFKSDLRVFWLQMQIPLSAVSGTQGEIFLVLTDLQREHSHTHTKWMQGGFLDLNIHSFEIWRSEGDSWRAPADKCVLVPSAALWVDLFQAPGPQVLSLRNGPHPSPRTGLAVPKHQPATYWWYWGALSLTPNRHLYFCFILFSLM